VAPAARGFVRHSAAPGPRTPIRPDRPDRQFRDLTAAGPPAVRPEFYPSRPRVSPRPRPRPSAAPAPLTGGLAVPQPRPLLAPLCSPRRPVCQCVPQWALIVTSSTSTDPERAPLCLFGLGVWGGCSTPHHPKNRDSMVWNFATESRVQRSVFCIDLSDGLSVCPPQASFAPQNPN
jgi:hypothetical protein